MPGGADLFITPDLQKGRVVDILARGDPAAPTPAACRSLLPADVGLLLHGRQLVLDFSTRPFDSMELSRILALCDQIVAHVPPLGTTSSQPHPLKSY